MAGDLDGVVWLAGQPIPDATYPTPDGLLPGNGALVAAVATAAGRQPDAVAGKPEATTIELVRARARGNGGFVAGDRRSSGGVPAEALDQDHPDGPTGRA